MVVASSTSSAQSSPDRLAPSRRRCSSEIFPSPLRSYWRTVTQNPSAAASGSIDTIRSRATSVTSPPNPFAGSSNTASPAGDTRSSISGRANSSGRYDRSSSNLAATAPASSAPWTPGNPPHANELGGRKANILVGAPRSYVSYPSTNTTSSTGENVAGQIWRSRRVTLCQAFSPGSITTSSPHSRPNTNPSAVTLDGTSSQASTGGPLRRAHASASGEYGLVCSE